MKQRIEYWINDKKEINYRIRGVNGKVITSVNQGFKREAGFYKSLVANAAVYGVTATASEGRLIISMTGVEMFYIPIVKIDPPK